MNDARQHSKPIQSMPTEPNLWQSLMHITAQQANPAMVAILLEMFTIWKKHFKNKMPQGDWDLATAQLWAVTLTDLGFDEVQFGVCYRQSLTESWPPTTAADFAELATKNQHYPDCRAAYLAAAQGNYLHAVCYETASRVGFYEIRMGGEDKIFPIWKKCYADVCREHSLGASFTVPTTHQLEHQHIAASKNFALSMLAKIKQSLGVRA